MNKHLLLAVLVAIGLRGEVEAAIIRIMPTTQRQWTGFEPTNPKAGDVAIATKFSGKLLAAYKAEANGGNEEGDFQDYYGTEFTNDPKDPSGATITWTGGSHPFIGSAKYLLVKGGNKNNDARWYIFDLNELDDGDADTPASSWDGKDTIELVGFWETQGAIGDVSIFSSENEAHHNPEPVSLAIWSVLAAGGAAVAASRRKRRRSCLSDNNRQSIRSISDRPCGP